MTFQFWDKVFFGILILINVSTSKTWEQVNGPVGGQALCIVQCKGSLFAGSVNGGVFRSDDKGISWYHLDSSYSLAITALAVKGDTLFAGTRYSGLFLSPDLGDTWVNVYLNGDPQHRKINTVNVIGDENI